MPASGPNGIKKSRLQLCDLPEEILIHIISSLPIRDSVATSLLSRRWRYLWTSITKLEFRKENLGRDRIISRSQFINFVSNAMIRRDRSSNLSSFSFACWILSDDEPLVNSWITSAIRCNVKDLSLHLPNVMDSFSYSFPFYLHNPNVMNLSSYSLPFCIFSCQSLVRLELTMGTMGSLKYLKSFILRVPSSICLPNLKFLKLENVRLENDESIEKMLSHPSLEELHIRCCTWGGIKSLSVTVPNLRVLKLHENRSDDSQLLDRKIGFSGDNLEYFSFKGLPFIEFCICGSAMELKRSEILVGYLNIVKKDRHIMAKRFYKLLSSLSWVRDLTLTKEFLKILIWTPELVDTIPVFDCVTQLNLEAYNSKKVRVDGWMIKQIYKRCPHLEHLNVMKMMNKCVNGPLLDPNMPSCFQTHLKRITIANYRHNKKQDNALQVLLMSAPILEKMIIFSANPETKKLEVELNGRPRASKDCMISVRSQGRPHPRQLRTTKGEFGCALAFEKHFY